MVHLKQLQILFQLHLLQLHFLENVVQKLSCSVSFAINQAVRLFRLCKTTLKLPNLVVNQLTDTVQNRLVFVGLSCDSYHFLQEYCVFFFGFDLTQLIICQFRV
jgi:hypothetical protein